MSRVKSLFCSFFLFFLPSRHKKNSQVGHLGYTFALKRVASVLSDSSSLPDNNYNTQLFFLLGFFKYC